MVEKRDKLKADSYIHVKNEPYPRKSAQSAEKANLRHIKLS